MTADEGSMSTKHTITINGKLYDAQTGLMVSSVRSAMSEPEPVVERSTPTIYDIQRNPSLTSGAIHQHTQKSTTLRRGHLATPTNKVAPSAPARHSAGHIARSNMITHFAAHPKPLPKHHSAMVINDIGPAARKAVTAPSTQAKLPAVEVKQRLIARASAIVDQQLLTPVKTERKTGPKKTVFQKLKRSHFVSAGVAVLLLAGYVTYLNMPGLSVRLAAAQSGVNASYPSYNPDGYSFAGPVAFGQGDVELRFKANGGGEGYTIHQQNSNWNSVAVLDNLVSKSSNGNYQANNAGGLTIYTYGKNAAWTNGGVLYKIESKAPLSNEQLLHIASSM